EHLDLLAYHYERSPNDPKAIAYLARAAARAASLFANADAVQQYQAALARAARPAVTSPLPPASLAGGLGDVYAQMAEFDAALDQYAQARADLTDTDLALAEIDLRRADVLVRATRFDEAMAVIERTEARIQASGQADARPARVILAQLANLRSLKDYRQGAMQQALGWAEQGLRHIDHISNEHPQVATTRIRLYQSLVAAAASLRDHRRAQQTLNRALRLIRRYPHPVVEGELQLRRGTLALTQNKLARAVRLFRNALPLIEATGTRDRVGALLMPAGQTLVLRGKLQEAQVVLERGVAIGEETGSTFLISANLQLLGWLHATAGNWEAAQALLRRGKELARQHDLRDRLVSFILFEGWIAMYQGNYAESDALFAQALDLGQRYGLSDQIIECHYDLAYSALMRGQLDLALAYREEPSFTVVTVNSYSDAIHLLSLIEWWAMLVLKGAAAPGSAEAAQIMAASENALLFLRRHGNRHTLTFGYRVHAMLAYSMGRFDEAWAAADRGVRLARKVGRVPEVARSLLWRGTTQLSREGGSQQALRDIREAVAIFARLGAQPEFEEASLLLHAAG
ncbi:MAG TPA: hypothetical protein VD886_24150, partial [Herpetosiphonaceae bacterium]|nr:hypothetical protein [Herpetosiphonaceae bacterium]